MIKVARFITIATGLVGLMLDSVLIMLLFCIEIGLFVYHDFILNRIRPR